LTTEFNQVLKLKLDTFTSVLFTGYGGSAGTHPRTTYTIPAEALSNN